MGITPSYELSEIVAIINRWGLRTTAKLKIVSQPVWKPYSRKEVVETFLLALESGYVS